MVDLILFGFVVAVFAGGFWCGKTFRTYSGMVKKAKDWLKS